MDYYEAGYQFRVHHSDMVTDEEDSRDSGMNKTFDMENLCELKIDELCSDLNDIENRADQFLRRRIKANRGDASTSSTVYNSDCMISQTPIFNRHLSRKRKCGQQIEYCERIKKTKLLTHTQEQQTEIHLNKNQELCHPLKAIATAKPFQRAFSTSAIETSSSSRHHLYNTSQNNEFELPKLLEVVSALNSIQFNRLPAIFSISK
ncbi:unnamed protein product [Anisakis simplex]|uniref:Uncharacterized protein n=1 Tax=Anisakis simplex TaxID=6269 RepID=A0A0M3K5T7_ANISI|nr:unnamed protein product [Anisakis simplex]